MSTSSQIGRRVLIAVDSGEASKQAVTWYINEASIKNDIVHLINVVNIQYSANYALGSRAVSDGLYQHQHEKKTSADAFCRKMMHKINIIGIKGKYDVVDGSKPAEYLIKIIKQENIDLIILGSRGLDSMRKLFHGSVSDYLMHHAHIPIAIIPPPKLE